MAELSVEARGPGSSFNTFSLKSAPDSVHDPALDMTFGQFCESSRFLKGCPGVQVLGGDHCSGPEL